MATPHPTPHAAHRAPPKKPAAHSSPVPKKRAIVHAASHAGETYDAIISSAMHDAVSALKPFDASVAKADPWPSGPPPGIGPQPPGKIPPPKGQVDARAKAPPKKPGRVHGDGTYVIGGWIDDVRDNLRYLLESAKKLAKSKVESAKKAAESAAASIIKAAEAAASKAGAAAGKVYNDLKTIAREAGAIAKFELESIPMLILAWIVFSHLKDL